MSATLVAKPTLLRQPAREALYVPSSARPRLYVDPNNGSDSDLGTSPGSALATILAAVGKLNQSFNGGTVRLIGSPGTLFVNAPLHFSQPIWLEGMGTHAPSIYRNFGTPNGRTVWDAVTTVGGSSVSSATAAFTSADIHRIVSVYGAGSGGGTYYDFIASVASGSLANLSATTSVARNATTDPNNVKMSIVGDWNRVVTDASITAGQSIITSPTAAWTSADVGTEVVIAGAGHAGQALRACIRSVGTGGSAGTAAIVGTASTTVSNARCAIGVIFGDLVTMHVSGSGLRRVTLNDQTTGANRIGSAIKMLADDGNQGTGAYGLHSVQVTNNDPAGAWEHDLDVDGSWAQSVLGVRQIEASYFKAFGARTPGETIRLNTVCHASFTGHGICGHAPTAVGSGVVILDPIKTAGGTHGSVADHFSGLELESGNFYCEGQYCSFTGGNLGDGTNAITSRGSVYLSPVSDHCTVVTSNSDTRTSPAPETDLGTNNWIRTNLSDVYRLVLARSIRIDQAVGAATYVLDGSQVGAVGATATSALAYFYLDPAQFGAAGKVPKLRTTVALLVNGVAPGVNFSVGLVSASGNPGGGANSVSQSNGAFVQSVTLNTPAANSQNHFESIEFSFPAAGWYALAVSVSGAMAANSSVAINVLLQTRMV